MTNTLQSVSTPRVLASASTSSSTRSATLFSLACLSLVSIAGAAVPFTTAKVTRVENRVNYGDRSGDRSAVRPAAVSDVLKEENFLKSESASRAELQYPDGTLVRVGQNTIFTFESESRTLSLDKGSLLFHIPKGKGGGTIKTASLTAAITGTAGKVSSNIIAIVEGSITLVPSGRVVNAGEFARRNDDGSITIAPYDPARVNDGVLVDWNGHMPGFPEDALVAESIVPQSFPDLRVLDVLQRTQNLPGSIEYFNPTPVDRPRTRVDVPRRNNNNDGDGNVRRPRPANY